MTHTTAVKKPLVKLLAILSALMLSLAACGGDEKTTDPTTPPSTSATQEATTEPSQDVTTQETQNNGSSTTEDGETTVVMNNEVNGVNMTFTYYADGDDVIRQTTRNVMPYEVLGVTTADEAKAALDPLVGEFQGVPGLEHSMEYGETEAVETLTVNYKEADLAQISQLTGSTFSGDTSAGAKVSLQRSIEMLEGEGFTRSN